MPRTGHLLNRETAVHRHSGYSRFPSFQYVHNIAHFPEPLGDTGRHRGRHLERLVDPDEIAVEEMQRHIVCLVLDLF